MPLRVCWLGLVLPVAVMIACEDRGPRPASPSNTSSVVSPSVASGPAMALPAKKDMGERTITMMDACDPETFNAALGPGTCSRNGGVRFDKFLEELGRHHSVGAWHFAPQQANLTIGQALVAFNHGGEAHTFTEVEEYGGGIVPMLNDLTGVPVVAPECNQLQAGDFIQPGASFREIEGDAGVEKYQCCIHPWMRAEIRVDAR
jgi:hypothetical protein